MLFVKTDLSGSDKKQQSVFTGAVVGGWGGHIGLIAVPALGLLINLHRPRSAAALIRPALELGWSPDAPMTVEDGDTFIANVPKSVLTALHKHQP